MTTDGETKRATPRTMRIAQMTAFRKPIQVTEMPIPSPRADGAIVRVEASGVCRSDWHSGIRTWDGSASISSCRPILAMRLAAY
jgi:D-arabinose 1-dehydrogenase-like Zn-dependent alcohol dehydrogenase